MNVATFVTADLVQEVRPANNLHWQPRLTAPTDIKGFFGAVANRRPEKKKAPSSGENLRAGDILVWRTALFVSGDLPNVNDDCRPRFTGFPCQTRIATGALYGASRFPIPRMAWTGPEGKPVD